MNLFKVNFLELYERHLCRHSQYGINVIHLISVIGSYLALFAIAFRLFENVWVWMSFASKRLCFMSAMAR